MEVIGLQSAIWANRRKTVLLLILFPALVFGVVWFLSWVFLVYSASNVDPSTATVPAAVVNSAPFWLQALGGALQIFTFLGPVILVWAFISFWFHKQLIFAFSGAKAIERKDYPEVYNIVENLCISRGLPTPNIGILEDDSLNAFSVGWDINKSWIVFSRGILNKLDKKQIEAVAGHELMHIINKDGLLMVTIIVFMGVVASIGELILRAGLNTSSSSNDKNNGQLKLVLIVGGIAFLILGYLIFPLVQLAVSRKREYLADAGSVALTHDKDAMIEALQNISQDSVIESIEKPTLAAMCMESPFPKASSGAASFFSELFSTHPSIQNRIEMLQKY